MVPFIAVGDEELGESLGDSIKCPHCGEMHPVDRSGPSKSYSSFTEEWTEGPPGLLQFYKCGDASYLVGIKGKRIK